MRRTYSTHQKTNHTLSKLNRKIITTSDGSSSIEIEEWGETYHSVHGAVQEAKHVYIKNGLEKISQSKIKILEMGFGTGLNAFLTVLEAKKTQKEIEYHSVEGFPLTIEEVKGLNYVALAENEEEKQIFNQLHSSAWNEPQSLTRQFVLHKILSTFENVDLQENYFDLIYFDVFGYPYQPDLWSVDVFDKMYKTLKEGGILTTYACRGAIKRAMKSAGFTVEVCPGPPGKREMTIAYKL